MKKTIWGIVVVIVVVLIVIFSMRKKPASDYVVKIGNIPIMPSKLPLEIALQKGFFKDAGVTVQTTELASANLVADALIRGDVDVTPEISLIPFLTSDLIDPGKMKIFSVTDLTTDKPFDSIIVKADSSIKSIDDLKGKKIGAFSGTTATNMLKLFFKTKNIDSSTIQFIQLPPSQQLAALSAGSIDALFAYEPTVSTGLVSNKMRKVYGSVYAELVEHNPLGAGLLTTKFITEHPQEAQKVVAALNRAYDYIRTNEKETREITASIFKFSPEVTNAVSLCYTNHSDQMDKGTVDKLVNLFVSSGELKSKPDLTNAYYQP